QHLDYPRRQIKSTYQSIELGHVTQINLNDIFALSSAKSPKLHHRYLPPLLDQFPPSDHSLYPPPSASASHLCSSCWCGVPFVWVCFQRPCEFPTELPIVLTEGDGVKIFVRLRFGTESARMLLKLIVYHPIHTQTSVSVSSLTPPISELLGILSRRFLFFTSPQKEAGKNIHPTGETTFAANAELPLSLQMFCLHLSKDVETLLMREWWLK
ncbi:hypothetical protein HID58_015258, partial [Brassica napus]